MTRHGFDCRASDNRVPCERSEPTISPLTRIENTMPKKKSLTVYHLSATENTLRKMPKFNPYQTGHGVIGDTKYNRRKTKRELRKLIDES